MTLSLASFTDRYPELAGAGDPLITAKLAEAARSLDATVWGDLFDDGHGVQTAQLVALSPFGIQAGLAKTVGEKFITIYDGRLEDLQRRVGTAYRPVLE